MTAHAKHNAIYNAIAQIEGAERITKATLAWLSRDMLSYVMESSDIEAVNRLIGVLTPMNSKSAILFFSHFLPWKRELGENKSFKRFGVKEKGKKTLDKKGELMAEFLSDEDNTIWTWLSKEGVEPEKKPKDFGSLIFKAVEKALKGDDLTQPLTNREILESVVKAGVSVEDLLELVTGTDGEVIDATAVEYDPGH